MDIFKEGNLVTIIHNCTQDDMRCECVAETPKGVKYHPALKAVYERSGAKGSFIKTGYKCPKCKKFYDFDGKPCSYR